MIGFIVKLIGGVLASCCIGWAINRSFTAASDHKKDGDDDDDYDHRHHGSYARLQGESPSPHNLYRVNDNNNNNNNNVSTSSFYRPSITSSASSSTGSLYPSKTVSHVIQSSWSSPTNSSTEKQKQKNDVSTSSFYRPSITSSASSSTGSPYSSKTVSHVIQSPWSSPTNSSTEKQKQKNDVSTSSFYRPSITSSASSSIGSPHPSKTESRVTQSSWSSPTNSATEKQKNEVKPARYPLPSKLPAAPAPAPQFPKETPSPKASPFPKAMESQTSKPTLRLVPPSSTSTGGGSQAKYIWVGKGKSAPVYEIPENVECLIKQNKVPQVLLQKPLSASTYRDFFAALLYAEDHYLKKWSDFKLLDVALELKQAAVYDKTRSTNSTRNPKRDKAGLTDYTHNPKQDKTFVSFVIDAVPEERPFLLSRDFVFARPSNGLRSCTYQGLIYRVVKSNTILVEFDQDFFSQHGPTSKYDVSFSFNRVCLKRFHQAIELASSRSCLRGFIFPDSLPISQTSTATSSSSSSSHKFNHRLVTQHSIAVDRILSLRGPPSYLVEGQLAMIKDRSKQQLSRTGLIVKEAVSQLYRSSTDHRILVCAPVNRTCDVLMSHLKGEINEGDMFRANAAFREVDGVPDEILSWSAYKGECFTCPPRHELERFRVVVSTYVTSFRLHSEGVGAGHFSHIFLVDASMATEPEVMVAVGNLADEETAVIVTGSGAGSPRLVRSDIAREYGLKTSYFERLRNCSKLYDGSSSGSSMFITRLEKGSACRFTPLDYD